MGHFRLVGGNRLRNLISCAIFMLSRHDVCQLLPSVLPAWGRDWLLIRSVGFKTVRNWSS